MIRVLYLVAAATTFFGTSSAVSAQGIPLQAGTYRVGSRYIQIAIKGERLCYHGYTARGSTVGSLSPDPKREGFYLVNGLDGVVIYQQDIKTILTGSVHQLNAYEADYSIPDEIGSDLQKCLESSAPFYQQTGSPRK